MIPVYVSGEFRRLINGSMREIIAECGLPALEKPAELIRHVANFVR